MGVDLGLQGFQLRLLFLEAGHIILLDQFLDVHSHLIEGRGNLGKFVIAPEADPPAQIPVPEGIQR
ncbi:hypothetical protein D3C87_2003030 [compost metagenome]